MKMIGNSSYRKAVVFQLPMIASFISSAIFIFLYSSLNTPNHVSQSGDHRLIIPFMPTATSFHHDHRPPPDVINNHSATTTHHHQPAAADHHTLSDNIHHSSRKFETSLSHHVFHDRRLFTEQYNNMNTTLKIYAYPHKKDHLFANILLPDDHEPGGNYASESYFKKTLFRSHFLTDDPSQAHLFYLPFSIASLRHDPRVGVGGIQDFIRNYVHNITHSYPYWNRTGGADHFYVACHSIGRTAMDKAVQVKLNAIQVVCSSSYFLTGYVAHKDASIPQIWPRKGNPPTRLPSQRKKLAFYAGKMNSPVRKSLVEHWKNDTEISVHKNRLKTPYSESLLGSKYCIHAKGYEVNTARVGDALYYGCVPVILADHYDLPYADILNWDSFSVVVSTMDIPFLSSMA